jgi:C1A family cysteine protease
MKKYIFAFFTVLLMVGCSKKTTDTMLPENPQPKTGYQPDSPDIFQKFPKAKQPLSNARITKIVELPQLFEISNLPPVGNQKSQNSCVAWAIGYATRSYHWKLAKNTNYGNDFLFSPSFIYNQINSGKDEGSNFYDAFSLLQTKGVCNIQDMPYKMRYSFENGGFQNDFTTQPTDQQKQNALKFKTVGFEWIDIWENGSVSINKLKTFRNFLSLENRPIVISVSVDNNLYSASDEWLSGNNDINGGHAMAIIAYDDGRQMFKLY